MYDQRFGCKQVLKIMATTGNPSFVSDGSISSSLSLPQDSPACAAALFIGHTLYTMGWLFKDIHFPDPNFRQEAPLQVPAMGFIFCSAYYLPMFCLTSGKCFGMVSWGCDVTLMAIGFASYTIGMLFHFGSDCQKYFTLKYKTPRSLITDGFFSYTRNPNYFGEVLIYTGYAVWSRSFMVFGVFLAMWAMLFIPNMNKKDRSMSRYPEFKSWKENTGFFFPRISAVIRDFALLTMNNPNTHKKE